MFQITGLSRSFGGRTLFEGVNWRINRGERWGLVGPNGAGKTTLLRVLAGEDHADGGDVASPKGWTIGYLPQEVRSVAAGTVIESACAAVPEAGAIEAKLRQLEAEMTDATPEEGEALAHRYGDLQDRFHALDGFSVEARAREILGGLGFSADDMDRPVRELSGGWGMRVALAGLLLAAPDLLLLDEPTNHLDLESLEWLEGFLAEYGGAWLVVSHDRYFLNRMVDAIAHLHGGGLSLYPGSYDDFVQAREERIDQQARDAAGQARRIAEMERFVVRFRAKATKARQVQSRIKMLDRIDRIEAPHERRKTIRIKMPEPERCGRLTLALEGVRKVYDGAFGQNVVYEGLGFEALRAERIALVGVNGAGKSTLLRILAGEEPIQAGERRLGHNVSVYYYAQHQSDALDPSLTVVQEMRSVMPAESETRVRGLLGAFLFSGEDADKSVSVLSGGEKARLALGKMLARPSNVLLLDEPTNHLDLESREVLEEALASFSGTIAFVSHDRYFINRVATKVMEVRIGGEVASYPGDYDYWQWKRAEELAAAAAPAEARSEPEPEPETKAAAKAPAKAPAPAPATPSLSKNARQRLSRQIEETEVEIAHLESRLQEIDGLLADPDVYADHGRASELLTERRDTASRVERRMGRWERLSAELEEGGGPV